MSRSSRKRRRREARARAAGWRHDVHTDPRYVAACAKAEMGELLAAQRAFEELLPRLQRHSDQAVIENGLGVLAAASGDLATARQRFQAALAADGDCDSARKNLALLDLSATKLQVKTSGNGSVPAP